MPVPCLQERRASPGISGTPSSQQLPVCSLPPLSLKTVCFSPSVHVHPGYTEVFYYSMLAVVMISFLEADWFVYLTHLNSFFTLSAPAPLFLNLLICAFEKNLPPCFQISLFNFALYLCVGFPAPFSVCALSSVLFRTPIIWEEMSWGLSSVSNRIHYFSLATKSSFGCQSSIGSRMNVWRFFSDLKREKLFVQLNFKNWCCTS